MSISTRLCRRITRKLADEAVAFVKTCRQGRGRQTKEVRGPTDCQYDPASPLIGEKKPCSVTAGAAKTRRSPRDWSAILSRSKAPAASLRRLREGRDTSLVSVAGSLSPQRLLGPTTYGHRDALVRGYVHEAVIGHALGIGVFGA
jgi:hypothetical protein